MRERCGRSGCGRVILVVEVVVVWLEEEPLRSDTRLPLESSPYIAGNFYTVNWQPAKVGFPFQHSRQRYTSYASQCFESRIGIWE